MRRREDRSITKHTLNLYTGDYAKLMRMHSTRIGAAKVIRDLIHAHIASVEAAAAQRVPLVHALDLDLEDTAR